EDPYDRRPRELPRRAQGSADLTVVDPRRVCPRRTTTAAGAPAAGPRNIARLCGDPRRDAVHVGREPPLARGADRSWPGVTALHLDLRPARLPARPADRVPRSPRRSPGGWLPALPGPDRGGLRRLVRQGPDEWHPERARLPARPEHRLRVRDP